MFERYTERARRVLFFARYEASQLGSVAIETEHLLLALIREGKGMTSRMFARSHISLENIRKEVEGRSVFREKISRSVEIPFSAELKRVLQFAAQEADRLLHDYIGTEHLLLGILREERSDAASILMERGIRLDDVRDQIVQLLSGNEQSASATPVAPSLAPSYELHVSRSGGIQGQSTNSGPDYWAASGFTVRSIIARLFDTDERRIDLPKELDNDERYDFVLRLPRPEGWKSIERRAGHGVERHWGVSIARESREQDVYVLSAPGGPAPGLRVEQSDQGGGGAGGASFEFATVATDEAPTQAPSADKRVSFGNLQMSGLTIDDLCITLEEMFARPFVNETGLTGTYDLAVNGEFTEPDAFFGAMRGQLGLVVAPARRAIEIVVVRKVAT